VLEKLSLGDWIQVANVVVVSITLIVLACQLVIQNRLSKAQLLRDRFEMYWRTYDPISKEQVEELDMNPEDYMPTEQYRGVYRDNPGAKRRYLMLTQKYEYLAFLFALRQLGIRDPLGRHWLDNWVQDLSAEREFMEVNSHYRSYYPRFARLVDRLARAPRRR
jgi:hypothetical protein